MVLNTLIECVEPVLCVRGIRFIFILFFLLVIRFICLQISMEEVDVVGIF